MRNKLAWGVGALSLLVSYSPAFSMPLIGDDLVAFQSASARADGNFFLAAKQSWEAGLTGGHFNPVGQLLGGLFHFEAHAVSATMGLDPNKVYVSAIFVFNFLALILAGKILRGMVVGALGSAEKISLAIAFGRISLLFSLFIQLHPWSNDPVTSYPMAGALTAVVLLYCVSRALDRFYTGQDLVGWGLGATLAENVFAILFYELAIILIPINLLLVFAQSRAKGVKFWSYFLFSPLTWAGVVAPSLVFLLGRLFVFQTGQQGSYEGTQTAFTLEALNSFASSIASISPLGTWPLFYMNPGLLAFFGNSMFLGLAMVSLVVAFALIDQNKTKFFRPSSNLGYVPFWALIVLIVGSLGLHSFTGKYSKEIHMPGQVYLSYTVACISFCIILSYLWSTKRGGKTVNWRVPAIFMALILGLVQPSVNESAVANSLGFFSANGTLTIASVNGSASRFERCQALATWNKRDWPINYSESVEEGIEKNYLRLFGESFCNSQSK